MNEVLLSGLDHESVSMYSAGADRWRMFHCGSE